MKPGKFTHAIAVLLSSIASLFAHGAASKAEPAKTKFSKKSEKPGDDRVLDVSSLGFPPGQLAAERLEPGQRYRDIQPGIYGISAASYWLVEQVQTGVHGIRHARLVSVADPTVRKTLAAEVLIDPARFQQV